MTRFVSVFEKINKWFSSLTGYTIIKTHFLEKTTYNPGESNVVQDLGVFYSHDQRDLVFLDVGAHHGEFSLSLHSAYPYAEIYSFEPYKRSMDILAKATSNIQQITVVDKAVANADGSSLLRINSFDGTNSLLESNQTNTWLDSLTKTLEKHSIPTTTIDNFLKEKNISLVHFLKLDIQGGELSALMGAKNSLESHIINIIYCEVEFIEIYKHQPLYYEIINFLLRYDFQLYNIYPCRYVDKRRIGWTDMLFVHTSCIS